MCDESLLVDTTSERQRAETAAAAIKESAKCVLAAFNYGWDGALTSKLINFSTRVCNVFAKLFYTFLLGSQVWGRSMRRFHEIKNSKTTQ
jgi:hypothetical protein